ncbi:hydroxymethylglutaryl-CoA synthase [Liquorilactobacillus mali]|uniref:hydroxymethylglutaryl-CoA synthase n=1 Tax=Liquorilactobacillus mali TaxID=1618 RepID=UPI0029552BF3|nr:hydroxymethylglutaryl-CoA synthase [Liquorilactobacillus mali]MDV7758319.1 hydroxymethylglutaryl-CoA synthase [Liquorilactobacillus mali]
MKIGIDKIGFATSDLYLDMVDLANARHEDPNKYLIGIGQSKMAVIRPTQDVVTMAAAAAKKIICQEDKEKISYVIFATESGVDNSKSAAIYLADLLGLKPNIRTIEVKQACYGATAALQLAKGYVALNPESKVLVIGADNARYGIKTPGEPTQGGGAIAMIIGSDPKILELENETSAYAKNIMDFWRPLGHSKALVDGKYSSGVYLDFLKNVWDEQLKRTNYQLQDYGALLFHLPYTKMGLKGLRQILQDATAEDSTRLIREFEYARQFNCEVGNLYTGSLYLSFLSLLVNSTSIKSGDRIGFFSYGSGAQAEFFTGILQPDYQKGLAGVDYWAILNKRQSVSVTEYEDLFERHVFDIENIELDYQADKSAFLLAGIHNYKRKYLSR